MAEGISPPRHYRQPFYLLLDPEFIGSQHLFLTKNGVILVYDDIPSRFLDQQDQLPTLACNVLTRGRGQMLPLTVTGGTWPADVSYEHVRREKGIRFVPGGPIPDNIRTTAWQFMGQKIPQNYGRLVFGLPLAREAEFDPKNESIHGLVSQQREESERDDQPIENPYEQPSRRAGSSQQREEPADQWEQQRSSSGSSEPPQDEQPSPGQEPPSPVQEQVDLTEDDPMGEEVVDLWEAEDPPDEDYVVEAATRSSISGSNPWVLYEAGIICARYEDGSIKPNHYGKKVITLREWAYCLVSNKLL